MARTFQHRYSWSLFCYYDWLACLGGCYGMDDFAHWLCCPICSWWLLWFPYGPSAPLPRHGDGSPRLGRDRAANLGLLRWLCHTCSLLPLVSEGSSGIWRTSRLCTKMLVTSNNLPYSQLFNEQNRATPEDVSLSDTYRIEKRLYFSFFVSNINLQLFF